MTTVRFNTIYLLARIFKARFLNKNMMRAHTEGQRTMTNANKTAGHDELTSMFTNTGK
jgi:hypothetical protein